jgi:hypothetical protein
VTDGCVDVKSGNDLTSDTPPWYYVPMNVMLVFISAPALFAVILAVGETFIK